MAKKKFRITEKDFLLANRKASREEEIAKYGKQVLFRTTKQKSKKVYDRNRLKKAGINSDDLPLVRPARTYSNGCKSLSRPDSGKVTAEDKGVRRETESDLTDRNLIPRLKSVDKSAGQDKVL